MGMGLVTVLLFVTQLTGASSVLKEEGRGEETGYVRQGPREAETSPPSEDPAPAADSFRVQVYATTEREAAESFRATVREWWARVGDQAPSDVFGASPPLTVEHDAPYYRVRIGSFATRGEARRAREFLRREYSDAFIVSQEGSPEVQGEDETDARWTDQTMADAGNVSAQRRQPGPESRELSDGEEITPAAIWAQIQKTNELVGDLSRDTVFTMADLVEIFSVGCSPVRPEQARANALAQEASHSNRDLGIELNGRYGQRSRLVTDESGGGLSGTYLGLEWDLLSQGFLGNRQRSTLLETRARAERLSGELARIQRAETCRARRIQERIRGIIPRLLEDRIRLARYRQRLLRKAYLEGEALLDDFLEAKQAVKEAERRLKLLRDSVHREYDPPPLDAFPPLVRFDFEGLAQATLGDSLRRRLGEAERRSIALQDASTFDTRLSVFGRYTTTRTFQDRDFEVGLRFSQPLFGALLGNDGVAEAERAEVQRREEELALEEQRENLRTVHRRFEEDQARAIRAHYRTTSRRERVRRRLSERAIRGNERLNEAILAAENLLAATIEKALAYGEVYEEVARAFSAAREPFDPTYLKLHPITTYEWRGRVGRRALYVWSEEFRRQSNDFLIELAQARKIERLVVSAGQNTPMGRLRSLQAQARENDVAVELLLAPNHWVRPGGIERARTRIRKLDLRGSALHLDVEPHMFDDFDQRQDELLRRYLRILRVARRNIGENELMVSVPLFWPNRVYREIAEIVDRAYLMAYGEKKTHERASQVLEVSRFFRPEQRVVALRPEDYENPWQLDQSISTLQKVVGTDQFALHDLESFLQFIRDEP